MISSLFLTSSTLFWVSSSSLFCSSCGSFFISFFASIQNRQEKILPSDNAFGFDTFIDSFQEARGTVEKEIGAVQEQFNFICYELQEIREENQTLPLTYFSADSHTLPAYQTDETD